MNNIFSNYFCGLQKIHKKFFSGRIILILCFFSINILNFICNFERSCAQCTYTPAPWVPRDSCGQVFPQGGKCASSLPPYCLGPNGITICIQDSGTNTVTRTFVWWGDGNMDVFQGPQGHLPGGQATHTYNCSIPCYNTAPYFWAVDVWLGVSVVCNNSLGQPDSSFDYIKIPFIIYFPPVPLFQILPAKDTICEGTPISFICNSCKNDANPTYTWYDTTSIISNDPCPPAIINPTVGSHIFKLVIENQCGKDSLIDTIVVVALPKPVITVSDSTICKGESALLDEGNCTGCTFLWSNAGTANPISVSPNNTTTYTVSVTDSYGCTGTATTKITVNQPPSPIISGNASVCLNDSTLFSAGIFDDYLWNTGATTSSIYAHSGIYTVTVTDTNGCTASVSKTLIVNPLPAAGITGNTSICPLGSTVLSATPSPPGYSYLWAPANTNASIPVSSISTFMVTITDLTTGCSATSSVTTIPAPLPTPAITLIGSNPTCANSPPVLDAGGCFGCTFSWTPVTAISSTITANISGTYTVIVTNAAGCTGSDTITVTIIPAPNATITGDSAVCAGDSVLWTAGPGLMGYLWSTGATTNSIYAGSLPIYTVTVTDANNCSASTSKPLNVITPSATISPGDTVIICPGSSVVLTANTGNSYQWSTTAVTSSISVNTAGTYTVTVTNGPGCTAVSDPVVVLVGNPTASISVQSVLCIGSTTILTANSGSGYLWSPGGQTTQGISINTGGIYTVTVTQPGGCTASASVTITPSPGLFPVITGITSVCQGDTAFLDAGVCLGCSYLWSDLSTTQTINPVGPGSLYTVTVTDSNGCTGIASVNVVFWQSPNPPSVSDTICSGDSITLYGGTGSNYLWSTGATTNSIIVNSTGNYAITVTDGNGCKGSALNSVVVSVLPPANITAINDSICQGESIVLHSDAGNYLYSWSNGKTTQDITDSTAGIYCVVVSDPSSGCTQSACFEVYVIALQQPIVTLSNPVICESDSAMLSVLGTYSDFIWNDGNTNQIHFVEQAGIYVVTVTNYLGCTATATAYLTVNPKPYPSINGPDTICNGASAFLKTDTFATHLWLPSGASTSGININQSGSYTVIVTYTNGCSGTSDTHQLTVMEAVANISADGPVDFCQGKSLLLSANAGQSFLWSNGETTQNITVSDNGIYTVFVINANGCSATSAPVNTALHENPIANFIYTETIDCDKGMLIQYEDSSICEQGTQYFWNLGPGTSQMQNPSIIYENLGAYSVSLTIMSPYGCLDSVTKNIDISFNPFPEAEFTVDPELPSLINSGVKLNDKSKNAVTWKWNFDHENAVSHEQNPIHYFDEPGDYKVSLVVTNVDNCESRYEQHVFVTPFYIPNSFTPNGDGKNERFIVSYPVMDIESYTMTIYSRWGYKIFETNDWQISWDGNDLNKHIAQEGTYIYVISFTNHGSEGNSIGKNHVFRGIVNLIR